MLASILYASARGEEFTWEKSHLHSTEHQGGEKLDVHAHSFKSAQATTNLMNMSHLGAR